MKFLNIATPLFVAFATFAKVNATGYYCSKHIIIKEGDACSNITGFSETREYYIRNKDLLLFNPNMDCDNLQVGEKLCVEVNKEKDMPWNAYFIKRGDTCESIARKLKTDIHVLKNINNYLNCDKIKNQVNVEIAYRRDGDYTPVFDESKLVSIEGNEDIE